MDKEQIIYRELGRTASQTTAFTIWGFGLSLLVFRFKGIISLENIIIPWGIIAIIIYFLVFQQHKKELKKELEQL